LAREPCGDDFTGGQVFQLKDIGVDFDPREAMAEHRCSVGIGLTKEASMKAGCGKADLKAADASEEPADWHG